MAVTSSPSAVTEWARSAGDWRVDVELHARFVAATLRGAVKVARGAFGSAPRGLLVIDARGTAGTLAIDAASVDTGNRLRDHHLRGRDFLGVTKNPQLRYELRSLKQGADELGATRGRPARCGYQDLATVGGDSPAGVRTGARRSRAARRSTALRSA